MTNQKALKLLDEVTALVVGTRQDHVNIHLALKQLKESIELLEKLTKESEGV